MGENRSVLTVLGSLLGLVILIFVIRQAVGYYQEGALEFKEMQRQAGAPVLLSETLHSSEGEEAGAAEEITATVELTETTVATTTALTTTTGITGTEGMTGTEGITATAVVTTAEAVTTTSESTTATSLTTTVPITASESVTTTAPVTASEAVTTSAPVTTSAAATSTESISETAVVTESEAAADEAPAESVALSVPTPEEVAPIFTKAGCIGCHVIPDIPGAMGAVGPNLSEIGVVAATRVEGLSAVEYIHQSILEPNAFIAPECPAGPCLPGLMIQNLGDILTPEEIDSVVAYMASLGVEK